MTTEAKVTLDKLAELDGGGARLAAQGALIAAATRMAATVSMAQAVTIRALAERRFLPPGPRRHPVLRRLRVLERASATPAAT